MVLGLDTLVLKLKVRTRSSTRRMEADIIQNIEMRGRGFKTAYKERNVDKTIIPLPAVRDVAE